MKNCESMMKMPLEEPESIRLNKYLSLNLGCSRRAADRLIESGAVEVDQRPAQQGMQVEPGSRVTVDGHPVEKKTEERILLAVNKPVGVVCTSERKWGDRLLEDILPKEVRLFPLGRLDKLSEGLILVTNDGSLVNPVMRASLFHEKEYIVRIDRKITPSFLTRMREGIYLEELNVTTRPCTVRQQDEHTFSIILTQGLNRQIRRMCSACGMQVTSLKRIRIMNIRLGDLKSGAYRKVTDREYRELIRGINAGKRTQGHS